MMKKIKRILSVLLILALSAGLLIPAVAAWPVEGGPNAPIITKQASFPSSVKVGDTITLEIEAELPEGATGTLSYAWYNASSWLPGYGATPIETGPKLEIVVTEDMVGRDGATGVSYFYVCVVVENTYTDESGEEQIAFVQQGKRIVAVGTISWWQYVLYAPLILFLLPGILIFGLGWVGPLLPLLASLGVVKLLSDLFGITF